MSLGYTARFSPVILESDILSLSAGFTVHKAALVDRWIGISHSISQKGLPLLHALEKSIRYEKLLSKAKLLNVQSAELADLLGLLNLMGALRRQRTIGAAPDAFVLYFRALICGIWYAPLRQRTPYSTNLLIGGLFRATWVVLLAGVAVCVLIAFSGLASITSVAICFGASSSLYLVSLFIHELVHIKLVQLQGRTPILLSSELRFGIVHRSLSPKVELLSAASGPVSAALFCTAFILIGAAQDSVIAVIAAGLVALIHLLALMPMYGDGISFRRALHDMRSSL